MSFGHIPSEYLGSSKNFSGNPSMYVYIYMDMHKFGIKSSYDEFLTNEIQVLQHWKKCVNHKGDCVEK